jgi:hypothetical protein
MKGQTSLLIKGIYLVLILVTISVVLNRIVTSNLASSEQEQSFGQTNMANSLLETIAGSSNCLAYEETGKLGGKYLEFSSHRILDKKKLDDFSSRFQDIQPGCARDFTSGYRVDIETFPVGISSAEPARKGVFGDILSLIDGKKVVFVLDVSGSMGEYGGNCAIDSTYPNTKICCLKLFMYGFIDEMSDNSEIAVYPFGDNNYCNPQLLFPFTKLSGSVAKQDLKNKIATFSPMDNTPMPAGLDNAFKYAVANGGQAILLLTDGCENLCLPPNTVEIANAYKDSGIPVYTIAYGSSACPQPLEEVASITNGKYFDARTCEELVSKTKESLDVKIPAMSWSFGDSEFSEKEALQQSVSVSTSIVVFVNETTLVPGKMTVTMVDGELERLRGFVDRSCLTGVDSEASLSFHYPLSFDSAASRFCLDIDGKEVCQKVACKKIIDFPESLVPGSYTLYSKNEDNVLRVVV